jgi:hypothetical protein
MTSKNYNKIAPQVAERLRMLELSVVTSQASTKKDIEYIKKGLDNHLNTLNKSVDEINGKLSNICPKVTHCYDWITKVQKYVVWPIIGLATLSGVSGLAWLIYNYI